MLPVNGGAGKVWGLSPHCLPESQGTPSSDKESRESKNGGEQPVDFSHVYSGSSGPSQRDVPHPGGKGHDTPVRGPS